MTRCISEAIDAGYRHIDGAAFYQNEVYVGRGVQNKIREGVVERKDLFMVSKVNLNDNDINVKRDIILKSFYKSFGRILCDRT